MKTLMRWVCGLLPGHLVGTLEYYLRPDVGQEWGGPFNGQCFRQHIVVELLRLCEPEAIVETGTYRGDTTEFLARNSRVGIYSSEKNPRNFSFASRRLRHFENVTIYSMDSREFLRKLKLSTEMPIFFYLDAHWGPDLPLGAEMDVILEKFSKFLIMIDDFQVPDDSGYAYDDYGPGKTLSLTDFPFHQDDRVSLYFPNCPSNAETGSRRGCILLASRLYSDQVAEINSLRRYDP